MLDIRRPIGLMFLILGGLLGAFGLVSPSSVYQVSLGYNLNLIWGASMAAFGLGMLLWQRLSRPEAHTESEVSTRIPPQSERVPK